MHKCKKCQSNSYVKAGFVNGEQRYKCRECGCQFVPTREKGMSGDKKLTIICLYINGLSFRAIGKILKVHHSAVHRFIKKFAIENYEKPTPIDSSEIALELDEMWHYTKDKKTSYGYGKLIAETPSNLLTGNAATEILKPSRCFSTDF
jgi:transposase-like protein